ncbi:hypothetical protein VFPPC_15863 [Pochonia chlamydosporia 170]|uniref:Uncharacterized protein n=1 Tax=Pochonia chlamydosporia 170 TaxID=1380566 RepID=A0A179FST4_METCM|nr:hypothetical protein VFPPC_15863 [Pochonia chlamydosporia 170]OAQ68672.1 hypothetical protein VFPPC_15863 [Pochonia chlamydosporia 170]
MNATRQLVEITIDTYQTGRYLPPSCLPIRHCFKWRSLWVRSFVMCFYGDCRPYTIPSRNVPLFVPATPELKLSLYTKRPRLKVVQHDRHSSSHLPRQREQPNHVPKTSFPNRRIKPPVCLRPPDSKPPHRDVEETRGVITSTYVTANAGTNAHSRGQKPPHAPLQAQQLDEAKVRSPARQCNQPIRSHVSFADSRDLVHLRLLPGNRSVVFLLPRSLKCRYYLDLRV